jgi:hypothetical protein
MGAIDAANRAGLTASERANLEGAMPYEARRAREKARTGHPADSADEFAAGFVTSATLFRSQFVSAVLDAKTAGNARGGSGGTYLRSLYRRARNLIDGKYVPLGRNPL